MAAPIYTARMDGWRIDILRDGVVMGHGRWTGNSIVERTVTIYPDDPAREAALHDEWVAMVNADVDATLAAAPPNVNEDGVDLALIDWMLSLTPTERVQVLQNWVNTFGGFVEEAG